jgi:hypothetical protein
MGQTQTQSTRAESYTWGIEIECFLPQRAINELGISIGSYPFGRLRASHHGHSLPAPFPQVAKPQGPPWRSQGDLASWTAEGDGSLRTDRRGYVAVEIASPILKGRTGIEQVKQVSRILTGLGPAVMAVPGRRSGTC